jgi:hypothetical protein
MHHSHHLKSDPRVNKTVLLVFGQLTLVAKLAFSSKVAPGRAFGFFKMTRAQSRINCARKSDQKRTQMLERCN